MINLPLNIDYTGKVVVITGAGGLICGAMARAFAQSGAKVAALDLNEEAVKALADELKAEGFICEGYKANVLDPEALEEVHQAVLRDLGACDILVNGAGGNNPRATTDNEYQHEAKEGGKSFFDLDPNGVDFVFKLNFQGTLLPTQAFAKDMVANHSVGIVNVEKIDYMSPLIFLRGESTLNGCELTGSTCTAPDKTDYNGTVHPVLPYDCGVPNFCTATFNNCKVGRIYAWSNSKITINDSEIGYIRCSTHKKANKSSHLTIGSGTVVDEIVVSSSGSAKFTTVNGKKTLTAAPWSPSIIIKAGARVNRLDYNGRTAEDVIIEDGAIIGEIVNLAE